MWRLVPAIQALEGRRQREAGQGQEGIHMVLTAYPGKPSSKLQVQGQTPSQKLNWRVTEKALNMDFWSPQAHEPLPHSSPTVNQETFFSL